MSTLPSTLFFYRSSQVNLGESKEMPGVASIFDADRPKGSSSSSFGTARPHGSAASTFVEPGPKRSTATILDVAGPRSPQDFGNVCLQRAPEWLLFGGIGLATHQGGQLRLMYQKADLHSNGRRNVQVGLVFMLDGE